MGFIEYLEKAGPYTQVLSIAMAYALIWMNGERKAEKDARIAAENDAKDLREKRTDDLVKQGREFGEIREAMNNVMREWTAKATAVLDLVKGT